MLHEVFACVLAFDDPPTILAFGAEDPAAVMQPPDERAQVCEDQEGGTGGAVAGEVREEAAAVERRDEGRSSCR
jgi:hypothetical protein